MKTRSLPAFRSRRFLPVSPRTTVAKPARAKVRPRAGRPVVAVGVDFSAGSKVALDRAAALSRATGSRLVAVHVVSGHTDLPALHVPGPWKTTLGPDVPRDGEAALAAAMWVAESRLREEIGKLEAQPMVSTGKPDLVLAAVAAARRAILLVIGVHSKKHRVRSLFLGTTAERVLRRGAAPVLLARAKVVAPYERILIPVDVDALAPRVLELVARLFPRAQYQVVNFLPKGREGDGTVAQRRAEATQALETLCTEAGLEPSRLQVDVSPWDPQRGILQKARAWHCDLIAMGTHARRGARRMLHHSIAEHVSRAAEVDVLAVPPVRAPSA